MSRFGKFFQKGDAASSTNEEQAQLEKEKKEDEEAVKEESRLCKIFEICRDYFIFQQLVGSVYVSSSFLAFGNSISCDIDGTAEDAVADLAKVTEEQLKVDEQELGKIEKMVCNSVRKAMDNLEKRARAYKDKTYKKDLTLCTSVSVTSPVFGLVSFSINISATVGSLLESKQKSSKEK
jgi:hypothetical protein